MYFLPRNCVCVCYINFAQKYEIFILRVGKVKNIKSADLRKSNGWNKK